VNFIDLQQVYHSHPLNEVLQTSSTSTYGSEMKVGIIDYIIKMVGRALTFGLLAIALRRKFERKYTR
jgi:hypothetical protein